MKTNQNNSRGKKQKRSVENLRSKYEYEFADEYNPYSTYGSPSANYNNNDRANEKFNTEFSRENENLFARRNSMTNQNYMQSKKKKFQSNLRQNYNMEVGCQGCKNEEE